MRKLEVATVQQMLREQKAEDAAAWEAWTKYQAEMKAKRRRTDAIDWAEAVLAAIWAWVTIYLLAAIALMMEE